ncbi:hypothetical protein [Streptomyces sp. NBC_01565]|uniref:hypothetical protein n=1 Tax=unclassified Streptomyces TaxID=2593676 RepID=UPI002255F345|nr:hypothetical protein [Streptomyces sp. NBC_01565]MCX4546648.1 hypothetical protein [Streptomyces sp. NBC_01565]
MQFLVMRVFRSWQAKVSTVEYQLDPLRGSKEAQDGFLAFSARCVRALLSIALRLDTGCQMLSDEGSRSPEKDTDQRENSAPSNSIHGAQPGLRLRSAMEVLEHLALQVP